MFEHLYDSRVENATASNRPALGMQGRLARICGPGFARPAGAADEVGGVPARWVAAPGTAADAVELLRLAAEHDLAVVPRGAGTKIDWGGAPSRVDLVLDTGRLAGIEESADPSTVEVGAGTPLRAVRAVLARTGRRLTLDPPSADATVGGVIAADEAGPLRHRYGGPADQVSAVRYLDAHGAPATVSRGADVTPAQLLCGSRGTLGLLLSATLRVRPAPPSRIWVSHPVWTPLEMHDLVQGARVEAAEPAAVEVDLPAVPPRGQRRVAAGTAGAGTLAILLEGGPADVRERANWLVDAFGGDAHATGRPPPWWGRYPAGPTEIAVRIEAPVGESARRRLRAARRRRRPGGGTRLGGARQCAGRAPRGPAAGPGGGDPGGAARGAAGAARAVRGARRAAAAVAGHRRAGSPVAPAAGGRAQAAFRPAAALRAGPPPRPGVKRPPRRGAFKAINGPRWLQG